MNREPLEVPEDLEFERREWRVERATLWVLVGVMLAAAAGLFGGGGPLSSATVSYADRLVRVDYDRFQRYGVFTRMVVRLDMALVQEGRFKIAVDRQYLSRVRIEAMAPEPASSEITPTSVVYGFDAVASAGPLSVQFDLEPIRRGWQTGWISVDTATVTFRTFVYP